MGILALYVEVEEEVEIVQVVLVVHFRKGSLRLVGAVLLHKGQGR